MFALVDGNNFYASCERVFQPQLRGKPLVVLSNNDGCAIARSAEAKALGIKMGQPAHELRHLVRSHGLQMRSANFGLYGDMSARVVNVLRQAAPRIEVYSIDESFIDVTGIPDLESFARRLRHRVHRWTGIPNCIGIGPTKTLAKMANKIAKSTTGVEDLSCKERRNAALESFPVGDLWGVGRKLAPRLASLGIHTAADLHDAPADAVLAGFGVTLSRTQRELQGHPCIALEEVEPDRRQIMVSRSFGTRVDDPKELHEALASFAVRACEKLRQRGLVAGAVTIFLHTDHFRPELEQHHPSRTATLAVPTADTGIVLGVMRQLFHRMPRPRVEYKKAGVALLDLARPENLAGDLFAPATVGDDKLMQALDAINRRFGRGTAGMGATGWRKAPAWEMRQSMLSPSFTTEVTALPLVRC